MLEVKYFEMNSRACLCILVLFSLGAVIRSEPPVADNIDPLNAVAIDKEYNNLRTRRFGN